MLQFLAFLQYRLLSIRGHTTLLEQFVRIKNITKDKL